MPEGDFKQGEWSEVSGGSGCRIFELELQDYLEGGHRPGLLAHSAVCPSCGDRLKELQGIISASRLLQANEEPPARVWANIRSRLWEEGIIREQASLWARLSAEFAFLRNPAPVAALLFLTFLGARLLIFPGVFNRHLGKSAGVASDVAADNIDRNLQQIEAEYESVEMQPAVRLAYQKSLRSLDNSIRECRDSLEREPGNDLAREYLLTAYSQKAEVLATALGNAR